MGKKSEIFVLNEYLLRLAIVWNVFCLIYKTGLTFGNGVARSLHKLACCIRFTCWKGAIYGTLKVSRRSLRFRICRHSSWDDLCHTCVWLLRPGMLPSVNVSSGTGTQNIATMPFFDAERLKYIWSWSYAGETGYNTMMWPRQHQQYQS